MTDDPNIVPEDNPHIESVPPEEPPLTEKELPSDEDIEEAAEEQWRDESPATDTDDRGANLDQPGPRPVQTIPSDSPGG